METHQCVCAVARRRDRRPHLDAVHLGRSGASSRRRSACPRTRCASSASSWAAASARRPALDSYLLLAAELARRTGRPVRCALTRRAENMVSGNRNATIQRVTAGARADGTLTVARRRVHVRARLGRLAAADRRPDAAALRLRERPHGRARREAEPAADGRLPGAGLRRGNVVARVRARQARRAARGRSARAAEAQLRARRRDGRAPVLLEGPDGVLPARRAALGAPPRGARPLGRDLEARHGDGEPDLVRRRRPAELRVGAARLGRPRERRHRDAGHRHGHPHGDGDDRGRGARPDARPGRGAARRLGARPVRRRSRAAPRRCRRWARPCGRRPPTRRGR